MLVSDIDYALKFRMIEVNLSLNNLNKNIFILFYSQFMGLIHQIMFHLDQLVGVVVVFIILKIKQLI